MGRRKSRFLRKPVEPFVVEPGLGVDAVLERMERISFQGRNLATARRIWEKMLSSDATIFLGMAGALSAGGMRLLIAHLIERRYIDCLVSTGANLYHDLHFDLGLPLYRGTADVATGAVDVKLREQGIIRVYDVLFPADVLYKTDEYVHRVMMAPEFKGRMGTGELHWKLGKYALETAHKLEAQAAGQPAARRHPSILATAHEFDVPVYSPSPGDSTLGLNFSAIYTAHPDQGPQVDPAIDVMEMAALVLDAKRQGGRSAVLILGGGAPKNFLLQTEPQLQEILGVSERGHDYFIQITDARPDTGGLSGATPAEAVSWGKIDPEQLPDCVVAYIDSTVALPLIAAYVQARAKRREPRRLYRRLPEMVNRLREEYRHTEQYRKYWGG
jgi:deoxyhypusine synthase